MRAVVLAAALTLATGCSNSVVAVSGGAPTPVPVPQATVITSGASGMSITTTSGAAALALVLTFGMLDYATNPRPFPNPASLLYPYAPAPELAQDRRISEQDCSKPVDLTLGNLRCK
jgi:hypothetical protein